MMNDQSFWKSIVKEDAVLNPVDRTSEVLFGTIMVLTFTGAISAATDGRQEIRELLWAALGCNVAWGFVRSEEHTSELQSRTVISYAVFCLDRKSVV